MYETDRVPALYNKVFVVSFEINNFIESFGIDYTLRRILIVLTTLFISLESIHALSFSKFYIQAKLHTAHDKNYIIHPGREVLCSMKGEERYFDFLLSKINKNNYYLTDGSLEFTFFMMKSEK